MDGMNTPYNIGRIPRKVQTGFSGLTADQLKNWINLYSVPCLNGVLSSDHLENWRHFVLSCRTICQNSSLADALLLQFCKRTEILYGKHTICIKHCHLRDVLLDYGPVCSFWCFSYERYNGILNNQPTNNRDIELQLLRRFLLDNLAFSLSTPTNFHEDFNPVCLPSPRLSGSLLQTMVDISADVEVQLPKHCTRTTLGYFEKENIAAILGKLKGYSAIHDLSK